MIGFRRMRNGLSCNHDRRKFFDWQTADQQMKRSSLKDIIITLAAGGLEIFERTAGRHREDIALMCDRLLSLRGEASAISLANEILETYRRLSVRNRLQF